MKELKQEIKLNQDTKNIGEVPNLETDEHISRLTPEEESWISFLNENKNID